MALLSLLYHILLIFCTLQFSFTFLDINELKTINYGIEILNKPIVIGEKSSGENLFLTSKHGQQYQCSVPDKTAKLDNDAQREKAAMATGIPELLRGMESGPCLIHTKHWWTYEFCYRKDIRQYRIEGGKIVGNIIYLGHFHSEFDWNNTKKHKNRLNRYHSQTYANGTVCELSKRQREAEVQFMCEEGVGDYIARIDEPETCTYRLLVYTTKICNHPYLKPTRLSKPLPIMCNPVLTVDEYARYMAENSLSDDSDDDVKGAGKSSSKTVDQDSTETKEDLGKEEILDQLTKTMMKVLNDFSSDKSNGEQKDSGDVHDTVDSPQNSKRKEIDEVNENISKKKKVPTATLR